MILYLNCILVKIYSGKISDTNSYSWFGRRHIEACAARIHLASHLYITIFLKFKMRNTIFPSDLLFKRTRDIFKNLLNRIKRYI